MSEGTGSTAQTHRNANGQFVRGHPGGKGRPRGSRNKLSEQFLTDLQRIWKKRGLKCLQRLADGDPACLARVVASVLPKEVLAAYHLDVSVEHRLFQDVRDFGEAFRIARGYIGAEIPMIEGEFEDDDVEPDAH
jgi:hypothetical protein